MVTSSGRSGDRLHSLALGAALLAVIVLLGFVLRPTASPQPDAPAGDAVASDPVTTATDTVTPGAVEAGVKTFGWPQEATDEEFCDAWIGIADSQALFANDSSDSESAAALEEAADQLVIGGVPANMSLPARSGYYQLLSGLYGSLGLEVEAEAVGAALDPVEGGDAAFASYLTDYCPA